MHGRKFQLKKNICANFQENTEYQDSGGMLVFKNFILLPKCYLICIVYSALDLSFFLRFMNLYTFVHISALSLT
jgi:hypothetical protein